MYPISDRALQGRLVISIVLFYIFLVFFDNRWQDYGCHFLPALFFKKNLLTCAILITNLPILFLRDTLARRTVSTNSTTGFILLNLKRNVHDHCVC